MHLSPSPRLPPALPSPPPLHTPYYCEENVHLLLQSLATSQRLAYALFVTNMERSAMLLHQKASPPERADQDHYVVWDYHVVAVTVEQDGTKWVWDRDSRLGCPVELHEYLETTFRPDLFALGILPTALASRFRLVPAQDLFDNFASDRSHMLQHSPAPTPATSPPSPSLRLSTAGPAYIHPPPPYSPLLGPAALARGERMNLFERWLDVRLDGELKGDEGARGLGVVLRDVEALMEWSGWNRATAVGSE